MRTRRTIQVMAIWFAIVLWLVVMPAVAQEGQPASFSLIALPDTQGYTRDNPAIFAAQIEWIIRNRLYPDKENIAFVSHLGDIVDKDNAKEWETANRIMSRLDGVVPYGMSRGNHDYGAAFQEYFPAERYEQYDWYGGGYQNNTYNATNANSYQLFSAGGLDFVILHLECSAPDEVLEWANGVLEQYADRRAIISTHFYHDDFGNGQTGRGIKTSGWGSQGNSGEQMWQKCFSKHANVFLVLCGHRSGSQAHHQTSIGVHGNEVHEILSDYKIAEGWVSGYLRIYRFWPAENRIEVQTYSPNFNRLCEGTRLIPEASEHNFELFYDMGGAAQAKAVGQ